uniref:Reverse transcriptase domain-containing protein n=1 Tax=Nothobranchius furzeri TaxID=105023 RepID=A0A8C6KLW6_NOTFU
MEQIMEEANLVCINDGRGTQIDVYTGKMSALDITLVSSELAGNSEWEVLEDMIGSDHSLVLTTLFETRGMMVEGREGRWIFKRAEWDKFRNNCEKWRSKVVISDKVVEMEEVFRSVIIEAAELAIPKTKGNTRERKNVPWWSEVCEKAIKARNKSLKMLRKTHNMENLLNYKKLQAEVRRVVKKAKRESWRNFCGKIGRTTPISNVWGMIRKMKGIRKEWSYPVLKVGDEFAVTNEEKVEVLVKTFVKFHSTDNLSEERRGRREVTIRKYEIQGGGGEEDNINSTMDMPFSLFELERALATTGMTSPRKDQICYIMLQQLGKQMKMKLLEIYNMIWETGKLPKNWKEAVIVPIIRVGKESSSPDSYKPIALTSHIGKITERMVVDRLTDYLERNKNISQYQSGFRKGRGTMDAIVYLEAEIRKALINKESLVVVIFDVEKAYDMVWKEGLLIKLKKLGVGGRMYNWIEDFLSERSIQVKIGSALSRGCKVENGTPQGSVISPILFTIMIDDVFQNVGNEFGKALLADDGAIWKKGKNIQYVQKKVQEAIKMVENWSYEWAFKFSVEKTKSMVFTKGKKVMENLTLYGKELEQVDKFKYLGVIFDKRLIWKDTITKIEERCKKVINEMCERM